MSMADVERALAERDAWVRADERRIIADAIMHGVEEGVRDAADAGAQHNADIAEALTAVAELLRAQ